MGRKTAAHAVRYGRRVSEDGGRTWHRRLEIAAAVLLALATIASAWSAYQASRWNGEQALGYSRAGADRVESSRAFTRWIQVQGSGCKPCLDLVSTLRRNERQDHAQHAVHA